MLNDNQSINFSAPNEEVALKEVLSPLWTRRWKILHIIHFINRGFLRFLTQTFLPSDCHITNRQ